MKKTLSATLILAMLLSMLAGCGNGGAGEPAAVDPAPDSASTSAPPDSAAEKEPAALDGQIKFGVCAPITGWPFNGEKLQEGLNLALEEINASGGVLGKEFVAVIEDGSNTQDMSINAVNKLLGDEDLVAILGPHNSAMTFAVEGLVKKAEVPLFYGGTNTTLAEIGNEWIFRMRASDAITANVAAKYLVEDLGATKVGIIYCTDEFGTGGKDIFTKYLDGAGIPWVAEGHNVTDTDMT